MAPSAAIIPPASPVIVAREVETPTFNVTDFESWSKCTIDTCPIDSSFFDYRPSLAMNITLLALFAFALILHAYQGWRYRVRGFLIAMVVGCIGEVLGYVGRVLAYTDPWHMDYFLLQICCLTFAPAFLAAGCYLCLSKIVTIFGADISRIPPKAYTWIFIACDAVSIILQAGGGGVASVDTQNDRSPQTGTNIMIAGLSFQVFTITIFILLSLEYAFRVMRRKDELDERYTSLRASKRFRYFLGALSVSILCIFIRSIFRVIEMAQGWEGALMKNQRLFFILEGVLIAVAVLALNIYHPGRCLTKFWKEAQDFPSKRAMESTDQSQDVFPRT